MSFVVTHTKEAVRFWTRALLFVAPVVVVVAMAYGGWVAYHKLTSAKVCLEQHNPWDSYENKVVPCP
jgi:hypothetical protein